MDKNQKGKPSQLVTNPQSAQSAVQNPDLALQARNLRVEAQGIFPSHLQWVEHQPATHVRIIRIIRQMWNPLRVLLRHHEKKDSATKKKNTGASQVYPLAIKHGNGKSPMNGGFIKKINDKWPIFHCHVSLPEGKPNMNTNLVMVHPMSCFGGVRHDCSYSTYMGLVHPSDPKLAANSAVRP